MDDFNKLKETVMNNLAKARCKIFTNSYNLSMSFGGLVVGSPLNML